jgi:CPA2 family monovalent cation:H+ antiporter-2
VLENVGVAHASCVVITFANPEGGAAHITFGGCARLREDVPILVRTQDDTKLEQLQLAGATEVVPETFEASLMLLSHLLLLLKLPVPRVIRTINDIRSQPLRHAAPVSFVPPMRSTSMRPTHFGRNCTA